MLADQGQAPAYVGSLTEPDRRRLKSRLKNELPVSSDGSINLTARAWAIKGTA